jgi:aromatic ring-opening dioxygenase LigB subunit
MTINTMGCLVLDFISDKGHMIPLEFLQATEIQQFQCQLLSCHALKGLGYEVQHAFSHLQQSPATPKSMIPRLHFHPMFYMDVLWI